MISEQKSADLDSKTEASSKTRGIKLQFTGEDGKKTVFSSIAEAQRATNLSRDLIKKYAETNQNGWSLL